MKKNIKLLLGTAIMAALLSGCGGSGGTGAGTTAAGGKSETKTESKAEAGKDGTAGKVIKYAMKSEPETLDPTLNNYTEASVVLQNLFTGLYQLDMDGKLTEGCAASYEVSDDGLTYTFKLKDGLKWSDGTSLTAGDFEYAWKRTLNPDTASPGAWYLFYIKNGEAYNNGSAAVDEVGVKAEDDMTLKVTLENPTAYFRDLLAVSAYFPVKKDVVEGAAVWTKSADTYVSNGPFMMKEINPQASYIMVKNPNYAYADTVKLDGLEIVFIESPEAALTAFNAGEIDVVSKDIVGTQAITQYTGSEQLKSYDLIGTSYYDLNCSKDYMSKPEVRKALSLAINREVINQSVVPTKPKSAYAYVPYGIPYAGKDQDFRDVVGDLIKEDVDQAKALMAEAGYPNGEGFPKLTFITQNDQEKKDVAQAMQAMWKENLGIDVEIVTFESKVYWSEHSAGNFDVAFDGWTGDYPDPITNLGCFIKSRTADESRWSGAKADQYDEMMKECNAISDNDKRMEIFAEAEKLLMDEMPVIPLYYRNTVQLVNTRCKDVMVSYIGHTLFRFADVQ